MVLLIKMFKSIESINFKMSFMGVKIDQKCRKMRHEKNRRFVKIWVRFLSFLSEK
jgi:hypothetical protein